jgi:hypothetical protein
LGKNCPFPDRKKVSLGPQATKSVNNIEYRENVENDRYLPFLPLPRNPAKDTNANLFSTTETVMRKKFESDDFPETPNNNQLFLKTTFY